MVWKTRIQLEAIGHPQTSFVTLTYRDDKLPRTPDGLPTLSPTDLRNWLKRFRKAIGSSTIRFYGVGEYSPSERPHYHLVIFNYAGCHYGKSRYSDGRTIDCCSQCDLVRDTWKNGIIETQVYAAEHGAYCSGYVMKKMTSKHDRRLNGRYPEFSRQSNRDGGIGITAVPGIAAVAGPRLRAGTENDVPTAVRIAGKISPLGRYLRQQVRKELGLSKNAPPEVLAQMEAEMLPLLAKSRTAKEDITLKKQLVSKARGQIESIKARAEMNDTRKRNKSL